jgi:hypothetical protein
VLREKRKGTFTVRVLINLLTDSVAVKCVLRQSFPRRHKNFGDAQGEASLMLFLSSLIRSTTGTDDIAEAVFRRLQKAGVEA